MTLCNSYGNESSAAITVPTSPLKLETINNFIMKSLSSLSMSGVHQNSSIWQPHVASHVQSSLHMSYTPRIGRCKLNKRRCTLTNYDMCCELALKLVMERVFLMLVRAQSYALSKLGQSQREQRCHVPSLKQLTYIFCSDTMSSRSTWMQQLKAGSF
jgi:hypothetical protein